MDSRRLIVLFGGSGSGKTTVLDFLKRDLGDKFHEGRKLSSRARRVNDSEEMRVGIPRRDVTAACDIIYERYGHLYGVDSQEIYSKINHGIYFGIVIQDAIALDQVRKKFPFCKIWYVTRPLSESSFLSIAIARGTPEAEIESRIKMLGTVFTEYVENIHLFDGVIFNAGSEDHLRKLTRCLIVQSILTKE